MPPKKKPAASLSSEVVRLYGDTHNVYSKAGGKGGKGSLLATLFKQEASGASTQGVQPGMRQHPYDMQTIYDFMTANVHHSRCIRAKRAATVGLGFSEEKVAKTLNPICSISLQDTLDAVADDYWMTGNGYLECVIADGEITGLHHVRAKDVKIVVEDRINFHYVVEGGGGHFGRTIFAKFGESEDVNSAERKAKMRATLSDIPEGGSVSELIHFRQSTAIDRYYGFADWLAAVSSIELVQMNHQANYDFHHNRGVPEFILWVLKEQVTPENWREIKSALQAHVGLGNSRKGLAINLPGGLIETRIDKLAMEGAADPAMFATQNDTLALEIVSAHGVPPLLAGIVIPGKLGANNELPNALMAFQALVIGQAQHCFEQTLSTTLANPTLNRGLGLVERDVMGRTKIDPLTGKMKKEGGLRTILDEIDLSLASTVGGMKQPLASAQAEGRDLSQGMKD